MYTQCSKCETVFKLSAEVLRAAGGQVRCGKCGELFNALARLAEDSNTFAGGESALELESRADSILESAESLQVVRAVAKDNEEYVPPGVEIAELEFIDTDADDADPGAEDVEIDRSMEFTLPPGELDRIFVETKRPAIRLRRAGSPPPTEAQADPQPEPKPEPELEPEPKPEPEPEPEPELEREPRPETPRARQRVSGLEVPDDVRREMLEGLEEEEDLEPAVAVHFMGRRRRSAVPRRVFLTWLGAAIVLTLLLVTQLVRHNREWSVSRTLYGLMGSPAPAPANLSAYQLRQWGVTGDPEANGTLRLRASIMNTAAQLQPYPLLRVTLADRFGKKIGARDFEPGEYLGKPTARLLAPGERADATLEILDPGKNAEGFEIDVCVRGAGQAISCANDVAPQGKR